MGLGFKAKIIENKIVSGVDNHEAHVRRNGEGGPDALSIYRIATFDMNNNRFRSYFTFGHKYAPWLDFIETGDELSIVYQQGFCGFRDNRVISYVNHSKSPEIIDCERGGFTVFVLFALSVWWWPVIHTTENPHIMWYILTSIFSCIFIFQFVRYQIRVNIQTKFVKILNECFPANNECINRPKKEIEDEFHLALKSNQDFLPRSSQERYLADRIKQCTAQIEMPVDPYASVRKYQEPDTKYFDDKSFIGLLDLKDDNLWKVIVNGEVVAMIIVRDKFIYSDSTTYTGDVFPGIEIKQINLENARIAHSRSSSSMRNSKPMFAEEDAGLYGVGWIVKTKKS